MYNHTARVIHTSKHGKRHGKPCNACVTLSAFWYRNNNRVSKQQQQNKNMSKYTKEEKQKYFENLREQWHESKKLALADTDGKKQYEALQREAPESKVSYFSFYFTLQSMKANDMDGLPYIDCKTFNHWKKAGYIVIKGEKSLIDGITWLRARDKDGNETEDGMLYPKKYNLFHRSQVKPIEVK